MRTTCLEHYLRGEAWLSALIVFLAATVYHALLRLWNARPVSLAGLMARKHQSASNDTVLGVLEFISYFGWLILGFQVGLGNLIIVLILAVILAGILALAYWRSRILGTALEF